MKIREATKQDIDQLSRLFDGYRVFYRKDSDLSGAAAFIMERLDNEDSRIYVAENEEHVLLGFVQMYPLFSSTRMKKMWLLNDLYVDPDHRGKGVSVRLIDRAKNLVRESKAGGMFLETEKSNTIGNSLYPRTGFVLNDGSNYYEWYVS